jgi:hypothetical protein
VKLKVSPLIFVSLYRSKHHSPLGSYFDNRMIFPWQVPPAQKRTHERYLQQVAAACTGDYANSFGICGRSIMGEILCIPDQVCIDYMHAVGKLSFALHAFLTPIASSVSQVLLGVERNLLFSLIQSSQKCTKQQLQSMCVDLQSTCTPHYFKRRPRTLTDLRHWKATELKHFLLYYGPFVLRFIDVQFRHHFMILSVAIRLLLHEVNEETICTAHEFLQMFVQMTPQLYGIVSQTHNLHILIHLADQVSAFSST